MFMCEESMFANSEFVSCQITGEVINNYDALLSGNSRAHTCSFWLLV